MNFESVFISIITSTYQRPQQLFRCFQSVVAEVSKHQDLLIEWIVVNDFPSTNLVLPTRIVPINLSIRIVQNQVNQKKSRNCHHAVQLARGQLIMYLDDDDLLEISALNKIKNRYIQDKFTIAAFRKAKLDGSYFGNATLERLILSSAFEIFQQTKSELAFIHTRESYLKTINYPESVPGFIPELFFYNEISQLDGVVLYGVDIVMKCEYRNDGITKNFKKHMLNNYSGYKFYYVYALAKSGSIEIMVKSCWRLLEITWFILVVRKVLRVRRGAH